MPRQPSPFAGMSLTDQTPLRTAPTGHDQRLFSQPATPPAEEPATALLIVDLDKHIGNARAWRDTFGEQLPDLEIRISPDAGNLADDGLI